MATSIRVATVPLIDTSIKNLLTGISDDHVRGTLASELLSKLDLNVEDFSSSLSNVTC